MSKKIKTKEQQQQQKKIYKSKMKQNKETQKMQAVFK